MSKNEVVVAGIPDVTKALQLMAKQLRLSITALTTTATGGDNGTLTSIGTGQVRTKDMAVGPLLRVLQRVDWELAGRVKDSRGILIHPEGSVDLLVTAADGGRIEVSVVTLEDMPRLLNTMAAANGVTITALNKMAKLGGGSLIGIAKGTATGADLRLSGLAKMAEAAAFELVVRPQHDTRRAARAALASARRG